MTDNNKELKIIFNSIHARLKAIKAALSEEQLKVYNESINQSKLKFQENEKLSSKEMIQLLEQYFV